MDPIVFIKGVIIGFSMAIPIGPVGIMCIRKALAEGHSRGLAIGLGAATADSLYGGIAAFGLTVVSDVVASQQWWMRIAGGGILLFLGVRTIRATREVKEIDARGTGLLATYFSSLFVALTNPGIVFVFGAVFAASGLGEGLFGVSVGFLILGVFAGSCLWFLTLSSIATFFRERLERAHLRRVNRIAGALIILTGIAAFVSVM